IRVGIHTGEPGLDPPKYVGVDVHKAARVMSVGHGGQVLLARTTRELVSAETVELGAHRLKDIEEPVWLYQLGEGSFPPLKSLNNTNLPTPASSFVGREQELGEAEGLLFSTRLLTITGPGGTGKTRFAIELGYRQLARFPNGVFWVGLAPLREAALVLDEVRKALGAPGEAAAQIGAKQMLIVFDNFEQVVEAASDVGGLLRDCPNLSLVVTTRELLRIEGERPFQLPALGEAEGVELFCERAQIEPDEAVVELCGRLEGLPLAVELAAARA